MGYLTYILIGLITVIFAAFAFMVLYPLFVLFWPVFVFFFYICLVILGLYLIGRLVVWLFSRD